MPAMDFVDLPKALLHDHIDGGVRPGTLLDLAQQVGYDGLPADDAAGLADALCQRNSASLADYLEAFEHTLAVMQTPDALERIGYEAVVDLAEDGVRYAELRFAPALMTRAGLTTAEVVEAISMGVRRGAAATGCHTFLILDAMRQHDDAEDIARLAAAARDQLVVGFDIAGPELQFPIGGFAGACRVAHERDVAVTLHAGESGPPSEIWTAIHTCGASRIGHGVSVIEDTSVNAGEIVKLGEIATLVRDRQIPLEISLTSNVHTGYSPSAANHPVGLLHRAGFNVTINTDNRLMSGIELSDEFATLATDHAFEADDFYTVTMNALRAGFGPWPVRSAVMDEVERAYKKD